MQQTQHSQSKMKQVENLNKVGGMASDTEGVKMSGAQAVAAGFGEI